LKNVTECPAINRHKKLASIILPNFTIDFYISTGTPLKACNNS